MYPKLLFLFGLILLSAVFSASETALVSISKSKVDELVSKGAKNSRLLRKIRQNPHKMLTTVLVCNNVINIGASAYAAVVFTDIFGDNGIGIATGVMTFFILVFGEIAPKSFAHQYASTVALFMARFIYILQIILFPIIWVFDLVVSVVNRLMGNKKMYTVTEGELVAMLKIGTEEGSIERHEKELIENVLEFNDIEVEEVMTPRVAIEALDNEMTIQEAVDFAIKHSHTRLPIYQDNLDNITGVISIKDLLMYFDDCPPNKKLKNLKISRPIEVPLSKKINHLFREFQRKHVHIAIVIDEYGGTAGLVTLEDLLEEIVGEIVDEFDLKESPIEVINDNNIIVTGSTLIEDINDFFKIRFAKNERDTISMFLTDHLHRFPREGEVVNFPRAKVLVLEMDDNIVEKVKITKLNKKIKI